MSDPLGRQEVGSGPAVLAQHFELALETWTNTHMYALLCLNRQLDIMKTSTVQTYSTPV